MFTLALSFLFACGEKATDTAETTEETTDTAEESAEGSTEDTSSGSSGSYLEKNLKVLGRWVDTCHPTVQNMRCVAACTVLKKIVSVI